ncbi:HNH endonuclease [Rhodococcus sp. GB-02]
MECGASTYLEYDHIIPFSRGGASTEGNVQLLCRACNLAKGARV